MASSPTFSLHQHTALFTRLLVPGSRLDPIGVFKHRSDQLEHCEAPRGKIARRLLSFPAPSPSRPFPEFAGLPSGRVALPVHQFHPGLQPSLDRTQDHSKPYGKSLPDTRMNQSMTDSSAATMMRFQIIYNSVRKACE